MGVRCLELVKYLDGEHRFGRFLTELSAKTEGFLPILWDAPKSDTYAVQDIGMVVEGSARSSMTLKRRWQSYTTRIDWSMPSAAADGCKTLKGKSCRVVSPPVIIRIGISGEDHLRVHEHGNRAAILFSASRRSLQLTFGVVLCFVLGRLFVCPSSAQQPVCSISKKATLCWANSYGGK